MAVTKTGFFAGKVSEKLKGESNDALAEKIEKKVISIFGSQIAGLESKLLDQETELEEKEEELDDAIFVTELPRSNTEYCTNIVNAQQAVDKAKLVIENTKSTIKFFKELKAKAEGQQVSATKEEA